MPKPVFFTVLLLLVYSSLKAQPEKREGGWAATLTGALIPISQPGLGIQPGIEYRFNERLSLLAEITIPVNKKNSKDSSELNKKYLRFKSEMRYYLFSKNKKTHLYAGLQASNSRRRFINQNSFYYDDRKTDSGYYYDRASINSPVTTISLQFGSILSLSGEKFTMDLFAGIGARFINTAVNDVKNPVRSLISKPADGPSFTASYSYAGPITMLHLNGGARLMWHFYPLKPPHKQ